MGHLQKIADCYIHTNQYEHSIMQRSIGFSSPEARRAWILNEFPFLQSYEDRLEKICENIPRITEWGRFEQLEKGAQYKIEAFISTDTLSNPEYLVAFRKHLGEKIFNTVGLDDFQAQFACEPCHNGLSVRVAIYPAPSSGGF